MCIRLTNQNLSLTISPIGATVTEMKQGDKDLLMPVSDPGSNPKFPNAIMAPFINRIEDGKYTFDSKDLQLEINQTEEGHALHGLVYNRQFEIIEQDDTSVTLGTKISNHEYAGYPFDLEFIITYTLTDNGLDIVTIATNTGESFLPYSVGWHPYLKPLSSERVDDCEIDIPFGSIADQKSDRALIPNGEFLDNDMNGKIGDKFFDNAFAHPADSKKEVIETKFDQYTIYQDKSMQSLQVFTPDTRTEIAIESQTTIPNAYNNLFELDIIKPGESLSHNFGFYIN